MENLNNNGVRKPKVFDEKRFSLSRDGADYLEEKWKINGVVMTDANLLNCSYGHQVLARRKELREMDPAAAEN